MIEFVQLFFSKIWEFFSVKWPGFDFSIGTVFLATSVSVGALTAILKMMGVSVPSVGSVLSSFHVAEKGFKSRGGNNSNIKISKERKHDTK